MPSDDCAVWALTHFGDVDLGDARLSKDSCKWLRM